MGTAYQISPGLDLIQAGPGHPLPPTVQRKMETFFQADFSGVRVHVDDTVRSIGATAFTVGSAVHFAPGQYNPAAYHGQRLLAHELAHVVQQRAGRVRNPFGGGLAIVQDPALEAEADRLAAHAATFARAGADRSTVQPRSTAIQPFFKNPFHTSKRWEMQAGRRPITIGSQLYLWKGAVNSDTLVISAHGQHKTSSGNVDLPNWVEHISEMGTYGQTVTDIGIANWSTHPDLLESDEVVSVPNYTLAKYQFGHSPANETYEQIVDTARGDNVDVLSVRNRWWRGGGEITLREVLRQLDQSNRHYRNLVLYFCYYVDPREQDTEIFELNLVGSRERQGYQML